MTEADVIEQLVEFQNVLLFGVSIYVTLTTAYLVALYAFLDEAEFALKFFASIFLALVLVFLGAFFYGASRFQMGLVEALAEIERAGDPGLTAAGKAALVNARSGIDDIIRYSLVGVGVAFYIALIILTFWNGWRKRSHLRVAEEK